MKLHHKDILKMNLHRKTSDDKICCKTELIFQLSTFY